MENKTKIILLAVVLIVLAVIAFYPSGKSASGAFVPLRNFAIADTSKVVKFRISDTEGNEITITRDNPQKIWMVEGAEFRARPENASLILDVLKHIAIRQDLDEPKIKTVLEYLAIRHKKAEFFLEGEDEPAKTWYIGNATSDHQGTFMLLQIGKQKSSVPFIVYKPGMRGTLDVRFFTSFKDWRYTGVYNYGVGEISKIEAINNDEPQDSFEIELGDDSQISLYDGKHNKIEQFDTAQVAHYVNHFKKLHYNHVVEDLTEKQIDSVLQIKPNFVFKVTDKHGDTKQVDIWKIFDDYDNEKGEIVKKLNPGYAFASINGSKELVRLQYYQWDNVLKPKDYFLKK